MIKSLARKTRKVSEFPLADSLIELLDRTADPSTPLFPALYVKTERQLNDRLAKPRKQLQAVLQSAGRPRATLHSFRHTFNNSLRDLGLGIEDRRVLMGHAANSSNMIYTHPNPELAREFVNRLPGYR